LLLGVPASASLGGMGTIIGSPPNLIAVGALESHGIEVNFLRWMLYGAPVSILLAVVAYFFLVFFYLRKDQALLSFESGFIEAGETRPDLKHQRRIVLVIFIATVLLWLTSSWHGLSVASISALPIVLLPLRGVLKEEDVRQLPWDTLLLVAGGMSLGLALQHTGLLDHYAQRMSKLNITQTSLLVLLAYLTMLFSNIMSHTATSTVIIPLGLAVLPALKTEAALIIGISASTAMLLPVSTPPNAIAYSTGLLEQKDLRPLGILMGLLGPGLIMLWVLIVSEFVL